MGVLGKGLADRMADNFSIALHAETIESIEIALPKQGLAYTKGRDFKKDFQDLELLINKLKGKRKIEGYCLAQLIMALKATKATKCRVVNHGNGCCGYIHNHCDGADGLLDAATVQDYILHKLEINGLKDVEVVSRFQTLHGYHAVSIEKDID